MRAATLLFCLPAAFLIASAGCRQTATTGFSGTSMPPAGTLAPTGTLAPVQSGQPMLAPMGGPTRVTPPPTGTLGNPQSNLGAPPIGLPPQGTIPGNPYLGPSAGYPPQSSLSPGALTPSAGSDRAIGSGVAPVGFTETGATVINGSGGAPRDPRAGGMRVIDMTGAPNPPGYVPSGYTSAVTANHASHLSPAVGLGTPPAWAPAASPALNTIPQAATSVPPAADPLPNYSPPSPHAAAAPPMLAPAPRVSSAPESRFPPAHAFQPAPSPSTSGDNLSWRRPGVR